VGLCHRRPAGAARVQVPLPEGRQQAGLVLLGALPWAGIAIWSSVSNLLGTSLRTGWILWSPLLLCFRWPFLSRSTGTTSSTRVRGPQEPDLRGAHGSLSSSSTLSSAPERILSEAIGAPRLDVIVAAATLLLGLLFAPLRSGVQGLIDRTFFPSDGAGTSD